MWIPHRVVNHQERARAWAMWKYGEKHADRPFCNEDFTSTSEKRSDDHPFHYLDGVTVMVARDGDPEDRWYEKPVSLKKLPALDE